VVKDVDEAGKRPGVDTVTTSDAAAETCTPICPQTTYKTKMEEYKDEKVNLKRQMQETQVSSGTELLDLENSTRCRQLSSDFDTSANVRSDRIPGHNRVCRIVKIAVGWRRRTSRSKTQMRFTSSYPRHLSVTKKHAAVEPSQPS
jgi:hypothetical protein